MASHSSLPFGEATKKIEKVLHIMAEIEANSFYRKLIVFFLGLWHCWYF